jgi:cysteinyl-tRNA synthetase
MPTRERDLPLTVDPIIVETLADDMNTPLALARINDLYGDDAFDQALLLLGVDVLSYAKWLRAQEQTAGPTITELIETRLAARARKDFKESDRIRDELAAMGIAIKDGKDADGKPVTTWEIAR